MSIVCSRINQNENDNADEDVEKVENNKKKKKENKVKYYSSFEPIKGQISTTCKFILILIDNKYY